MVETYSKGYRESGTPSVASGFSADREAAMDALILRGILHRLQAEVRWVPGTLQVADSMTKDKAECQEIRQQLPRKANTACANECDLESHGK